MANKEIDLIPSELRAIEVHKYYLSRKERREVSLEDAIVDFLINYETDFLMAKHIEDVKEQNAEIMKYKWIESEKEGYDIGAEKAALEWVERYGAIWRDEKESLEKNGFTESSIVIDKKEGLNIEIAVLADAARRHDAELYVHTSRMRYYNLILFGKGQYLNVKSILCPKYLETEKGETIMFIATGNGAKETLEEVERLIRN